MYNLDVMATVKELKQIARTARSQEIALNEQIDAIKNQMVTLSTQLRALMVQAESLKKESEAALTALANDLDSV